MPDTPLIVYSPSPSPRLEYAFRVLLGVIHPMSFRLTHSISEFARFEGARISYSPHAVLPPGEALWLPSGSLLFNREIKPLVPALCSPGELAQWGLPAWPALFPLPVSREAEFPFDLPSMCFYLLSRYEEYLPFAPDRFGRFSSGQSQLSQLNLLEYPLVDFWATVLKNKLQARWPGLPFQNRSYRFLPTYDIDVAWAFRHRPLWRHVLASARDVVSGNWENLAARMQALAGKEPDPYDVYGFLDQEHRKRGLTPEYFFLVGNYGAYDTNLHHKNKAFQGLIRDLSRQGPVGLHPSMASNDKQGRLEEEKRRLERITGTAVSHARQHYLKFRLPETYRRLLQAGITKEYSMGFADAPGFRAGTCGAFPWYDLPAEQETALWVQPLHVMDGALKNYLRLPAKEAIEKAVLLANRCKQVDGTFCSLWHNSSLSEREGWEGWKQGYLDLLDEAGSAPPGKQE
ncbi:MAG: polysaccharide deacetylase family protein [Haliscomenobacter sp.]|nr:polysaccharide deacetylase family protein [Haliscomenobacter sp.]